AISTIQCPQRDDAFAACRRLHQRGNAGGGKQFERRGAREHRQRAAQQQGHECAADHRASSVASWIATKRNPLAVFHATNARPSCTSSCGESTATFESAMARGAPNASPPSCETRSINR